MSKIIKLEYILGVGDVSDEPHRTKLNTIDSRHFLGAHRHLIAGKVILDIGSGRRDAGSGRSYLSKRRDLGYKSCVSLGEKLDIYPDVAADFEQLPFKAKSFDVVLALQVFPTNLQETKNVLREDGLFIHQSGEFFYKREKIEDRVSEYFKIIDKVEYYVRIMRLKHSFKYELHNIFIIGQKTG